MIRGSFVLEEGLRRPYVDALLGFPGRSSRLLDVRMLVDTGADWTILAPADSERLRRELGISLAELPLVGPSSGFGGSARTRLIEPTISLSALSFPLALTLVEPPPGPPPPIPSLLGRDVMGRFALFLEERSARVLLLEPHEAERVRLG